MKTDKSTPGSLEAKKKGCTCPERDNCRGRGYMSDGEKFGWVIAEICPVHGKGTK